MNTNGQAGEPEDCTTKKVQSAVRGSHSTKRARFPCAARNAELSFSKSRWRYDRPVIGTALDTCTTRFGSDTPSTDSSLRSGILSQRCASWYLNHSIGTMCDATPRKGPSRWKLALRHEGKASLMERGEKMMKATHRDERSRRPTDIYIQPQTLLKQADHG